MHRLYYQHPGTWFGDCMPLFADGAFQLFHQRDTRAPEPFGEPFGWALARTTDFVRYEDLGEVVHRGADDAQDQFIFAGSVFESHTEGEAPFHAFYTGYNRDYPQQGRAAQVLMRATSDDLTSWTKQDGVLVAPEHGYDPDNWRDPFVLRDEEHDRWIMILGARGEDELLERNGRTVWFTSTDLTSWHFEGDFWAPELYTMHEMPDLFQMGDHWYLLTTEYSDKSKTVYRTSRSLEGPWSAPVDDAFDGRAYYAARSASDGKHRYLFGWVATKEGNTDLGGWQWGGALVVHEVFQRPDSSLGVRIPHTVLDAFGEPELLAQDAEVAREDGRAELALGDAPSGGPLLLSVSVTPQRSRSFGVELFAGEHGDGYAFTFRTEEHRVDFDRVPNYPWYRFDNRGLDRPIVIEAGRRYDIQVVIDDTIATLYVDGVALNVRFYERPGTRFGLSVIDGGMTVHSATLAALRR